MNILKPLFLMASLSVASVSQASPMSDPDLHDYLIGRWLEYNMQGTPYADLTLEKDGHFTLNFRDGQGAMWGEWSVSDGHVYIRPHGCESHVSPAHMGLNEEVQSIEIINKDKFQNEHGFVVERE
jgi:hypothetical protein